MSEQPAVTIVRALFITVNGTTIAITEKHGWDLRKELDVALGVLPTIDPKPDEPKEPTIAEEVLEQEMPGFMETYEALPEPTFEEIVAAESIVPLADELPPEIVTVTPPKDDKSSADVTVKRNRLGETLEEYVIRLWKKHGGVLGYSAVSTIRSHVKTSAFGKITTDQIRKIIVEAGFTIPFSQLDASEVEEPMARQEIVERLKVARKPTPKRQRLTQDERIKGILVRCWERFKDKPVAERIRKCKANLSGAMISGVDVVAKLREYGITVDLDEQSSKAPVQKKPKTPAQSNDRQIPVVALEPPKPEEIDRPALSSKSIDNCRAPHKLAKHPPEVTIQLIHALARQVRRRWPADQVMIHRDLKSCGCAEYELANGVDRGALSLTPPEIKAFDYDYSNWLDAYSQLPPFRTRDIDAELLRAWRSGQVAA